MFESPLFRGIYADYVMIVKNCPMCGREPVSSDFKPYEFCGGCGLDFYKFKDKKNLLFWSRIVFLIFVLFLTFILYMQKDDIYGLFLYDKNKLKTTTGEIVISKRVYVGNKNPDVYRIEYIFSLGEGLDKIDNMYTSARINFARNRTEVSEYLAKYPVNKRVTVYYDSDDPSFSVLEPYKVDYERFIREYLIVLFTTFLPWLVVYIKYRRVNIYKR